jgi:hypothetical protein
MVVSPNAEAADAAIARFRAIVMADEELQGMLASIDVPEHFVACAVSAAATHGIVLDTAAAHAAIAPDPANVRRWFAGPIDGRVWPGRDWLPVHVGAADDPYVEWAHFAGRPLAESFFEESARRAASRPFNRVFRYRMALDDFVAQAASGGGVEPGGFIFHMSRCGSTLVAQMLAAQAETIVVSEAAPLDAMVQLGLGSDARPDAARLRPLAAMIAAFGRARTDTVHRYFIKLDSWHVRALPLFRRAFPGVPWVFLYRDPVEVMVSQMRQRGLQTVPGIHPARFYGIDGAEGIGDEEYCARVLGSVCRAAAEHFALGGGLLADYRELPDAVWTRILPHFGIAPGDVDRAAMTDAARYHAKAPYTTFSGDTDAKQRDAPMSLRRCAARHIGPHHRRLEAMRLQGGTA